jgi:hypothetical protein
MLDLIPDGASPLRISKAQIPLDGGLEMAGDAGVIASRASLAWA